MAKKSSKKQVGKIAAYIAILLGIVSVIMMFIPTLAIKADYAQFMGKDSYSGLNITFGLKEKGLLGGEYTVFNFSFMNLLTYLLAIAGIVFSILGALGKGSKFASFIAAAAFLVSGIFFFCAIGFTSVNDDLTKIVSALSGDIKDIFTLGAGAIIGGTCSILAALCCGYKAIAK